MKKVKQKICIAGATGSGRRELALMLSEITGLPVLSWDEVIDSEDASALRGIVYEVGSDDRADLVRECNFTVIQYRNEGCKKTVRIPEEEGDLFFKISTGEALKDVYYNLVKLFETHLVEDTNV